jgi:hypothetical protein
MGFADKQGIYSKFRHSNFTQCGQEWTRVYNDVFPETTKELYI